MAKSPWQLVKTSPHTNGEVGVMDLPYGSSVSIGRGGGVSEFGRIDHKYISRMHCTISVQSCGDTGSKVVVQQLGKNPTLFSNASNLIEMSGAPRDINASDAREAALSFKHAHAIGPTTLHFPAELGLPMVHVHCVRSAGTQLPSQAVLLEPTLRVSSSCSQEYAEVAGEGREANDALTIQRMLTVPVAPESESEGDEAPPPPRQLKLLDEALRQQVLANAARERRDAEVLTWVPPASRVAAAAASAGSGGGGGGGGGAAAAPQQKPSVALTSAVAVPCLVDDDDEDDFDPPALIAPPPPSARRGASASMPSTASQQPLPEVKKEVHSHAAVTTTTVVRQTKPPPAAVQSPAGRPPAMGFWEWKSHADGDDKDPKCWRRYAKAVADVLEAAYRKDGGKQSTVAIDAVYSVCFDDARVGMVQIRTDDPSRWRAVRRRGGDVVPRPHARKKTVARDTGLTSSSSDDDDADDDDSDRPSWIVSDDDDDSIDSSDDDDSDVSFDTESSSDSETRRKKKKKPSAEKKHAKAKAPAKRGREDD